jgi:Phasin protein
MARSSQAGGERTARTVKPKSQRQRAPARDNAARSAASTARRDLRQPPPAPADIAAGDEAGALPLQSPVAEPAVAELAAEAELAIMPAACEALPEPARAVEPPPVSEPRPTPADEIVPPPARAAAPAPDLTAMFQAGRALVEGSIRVRSQMLGFGCRQAEHGFALGRAMLAGGSLPEVLALQAKYVGRAVDDALAHTLELSRLSTDVVRAGLESFRPR